MKIGDFTRSKLGFILTNLFLSVFFMLLLYVVKPRPYFVVFIPGLFFFGGLAALLPEFFTKKQYYTKLQNLLDQLEEKRFLPEMIDRPDFFDGQILYDTLRRTAKSMSGEIGKHRLASLEYREYIEMWVHEIKTPIAGTKLICENTHNQEILTELDKIEFLAEQVLFYSRSGSVEKDYIIKAVPLSDLVGGALRNNAVYLIANKVKITALELDWTVFTDAKWVVFILRQIMDNSVKYGGTHLEFRGVPHPQSVSLFIRDDGVGIPEKDIPRVFDKGFTGENGRRFGRSTGFGLYLCKKLCTKLGLAVSIASEAGQGAAVEIQFPKSEFNLP
ncbi:MAG: sensor histidine kinase [Peptococcaceae bacterium]|jgi:signal transduction histidine kinase|nr:sensor histidine kinase [Peptococcaceae bacterium]